MTDNQNCERLLMEEGLNFFGKISASFSHEINNAVNTISEISGLLSDLLAMSEQGKPLKREKLKSISSNISEYTDRGQKMIKKFNRFAHSADEARCDTNLVELLDTIVALTRRLADRKRMNIETSYPGDKVVVNTNPFFLEMIVFTFLEAALETPRENATITFTIENNPPSPVISLSSPSLPEREEIESRYPLLSMLAGELDAAIAHSPNQISITLHAD